MDCKQWPSKSFIILLVTLSGGTLAAATLKQLTAFDHDVIMQWNAPAIVLCQRWDSAARCVDISRSLGILSLLC